MKFLTVVGARPNFVKIAALEKAFQPFRHVNFQIIHTGQHYDSSLDAVFFQQLEIPKPLACLGIGSDTPSRQLAKMLLGLEPVFEKEKPDLVIVVGDTNSALAGALTANKMSIPVAHVEAGLRSGDRTMPEEINRILTDTVSDFLFVTEQAGLDNLAAEGVSEEKVFFTGNCMIDTLVRFQEKSARTNTVQQLDLSPRNYVLITLHRPSNVDTIAGLKAVIRILEAVNKDIQVVFPLHPRTKNSLEKYGLIAHLQRLKNVRLLEPQGYLEFLNLLENAALVLTDSGGIQDETTFLRVPCLTLRTTTERPVTVALGTNGLLAVADPQLVWAKIRQALSGQWKTSTMPPLWDGQSARRIAEILTKLFPENG